MSSANPIYLKAREQKRARGRVWLDPCDVAVLIRGQLKARYPGVKFSVRTNKYANGSSVYVNWTEGPPEPEVNELVKSYQFADFDGMIDLMVHNSNWLLPDGTMSLAHTPGTTGSKGRFPEVVTDPPHPQALLVDGGPNFVFAHQTRMEARR